MSRTSACCNRGALAAFHPLLRGLVCAGLLGVSLSSLGAAPSTKARISVSPFPYDLTREAVQKVTSLVHSNADLYTVQLDNGVPWKEALAESAFPEKLMDQWRRHKESIAPHHQVYVAIAPLAEDRTSWAAGYDGAKAPAWARNEGRLTDELKSAYLKYVLRVIDYFHPAYLNIGVESGDMAAKLPKKWPLFEALYTGTAKEIRAKYPDLKIGISTGLPFLQMKGVLDRVKTVFDHSDYVGISFYPYMSEFYEKFGAPPLPEPPAQWRRPLEWLHQHVEKPIAICETGYSSETVRLPKFGLTLHGDPKDQAEYARDLANLAQRDHYLFTVFFLAVDYDALMEKMAPGDERPRLWGRTGFFDKHGNPKPAWSSFQSAWFNDKPDAAGAGTGGAKVPSRPERVATTPPPRANPSELGFATAADLFTAPTSDEVSLQTPPNADAFMRWKFDYKPGQFAWAVKNVPPGSAKGSRGLQLNLRSDRKDPLLLQVEESDGEAFFCVLKPTSDWKPQTLAWTEFTPDATKKKNGVIDADRIVRIMIADGAGVDSKAKGTRAVDITKLGFLRSERER